MSLLDSLVSTPGSGVASVCSAHPVVLDETLRHAARTDRPALVEATCNQVNHEGGYTGMTPADFARDVRDRAREAGLPPEALALGGDHLGPNPWKHLSATDAMARAEQMTADYAAAGFTKLHLDTSIRCADDPPGALAPEVAAARAARLAVVAERAADPATLRYVIGTEVPVPGGESAGDHGIHVSTTTDVAHTLGVSRAAFEAAGVASVWERVRAVVAQPGVEFSDRELFDYHPGQAAHLTEVLPATMVFEAHSTDYQRGEALAALVHDRFAVLKVGPGLTYAYREAMFALAAVEDELLGTRGSGLRTALEAAMLADPRHWEPFYPSTPVPAAFARAWSRSDRSRYYWPVPGVEAAVCRLLANLDRVGIPDELASQYLPWLSAGEVPGIALDPAPTADVVRRAAVRRVLDVYAAATPPPVTP